MKDQARLVFFHEEFIHFAYYGFLKRMSVPVARPYLYKRLTTMPMTHDDEKKDLNHNPFAQNEPQNKLLTEGERKSDTSLRDLFNRFLEEDFFVEPFDFTRNARLGSLFNRQFIPRIDVSETPTQVKVVADVPGVNPDTIDIDIESNRMRISGTTLRESSPDERPYRYERTFGEFRREFMLPSEVNKDDIKAVYKDGILTITLPKMQGSKKDKIKIERQ